MPKISVISIANNESALEALDRALSVEYCQDFEFIGDIGDLLPANLNQAIERACGDIVVFLDSYARPVNGRWLGELTDEMIDEITIVKGLEVTGSPLNPSSLAGYREAFIDHPFDETYLWSEDTELFCRLKEAGYRFLQLDCAPVIHLRKPGSKKYMRRAFRYGLYWSRLRHRYAEPVELTNVLSALKRMIASLLSLLGMLAGYIIFWPERRAYKIRTDIDVQSK